MITKDYIKRLAQAVCVCALAVSACLLLYSYDNKYVVSGPRGMNGALLLDEYYADRYAFLIDGWAVYGGVLLAPEDFLRDAPEPDEYVFIGQYGGFEKFTGSPHGSVTYRMVIGVPGETRGYMLALPEIFSSCRVYVNGKELLSLGETDPARFRFETGNAVITFEASGKIDLLIAVSDFTHMYSGMVYPPALGSPNAVSHMLNMRLVLRAAMNAVALIIGVAALLIGLLSGRKGLAALYGLLCMLFAGYTSYPVTLTLARGSVPLYAVENVSFCAMLLVVIVLQNRIYPDEHPTLKIRPYMIFAGFGALICAAALAMPFLSPRSDVRLMLAYSNLITAYEWLTAVYVTITAGLALHSRTDDAAPLFYGMLTLDCALVMDRILHSYEPVISGWFPELGSFVLILSVGMTAVREIVRQYHENAVLEERVRGVLSSGRDYYGKLTELTERLHILRHDYKYHLSAMRKLFSGGDSETAREYLDKLDANTAETFIREYCASRVLNAYLDGFAERCEREDIEFSAKIIMPPDGFIDDYELCVILGNLLENAITACQRTPDGQRRYIELSMRPRGEQYGVKTENSYDGELSRKGGELRSTKQQGGGLGISSVKAIAKRFSGEYVPVWDEKKFSAFVVLKLDKPPNSKST